MMKAILGSAMGGVVAGIVALVASAQGRAPNAVWMPQGQPTSPYAISVADSRNLDGAMPQASTPIQCAPQQQAVLQRAFVNGSEVAQVMWDGVYGLSLGGTGAGKIHLPSDYQYKDGEPGQLIGARTPFGKTVRISEKREGGDGRKELADWLGRENEFPHGAFLLTGTGIVPPDEFTLEDGDRIAIAVTGIGTLENPVVKDAVEPHI